MSQLLLFFVAGTDDVFWRRIFWRHTRTLLRYWQSSRTGARGTHPRPANVSEFLKCCVLVESVCTICTRVLDRPNPRRRMFPPLTQIMYRCDCDYQQLSTRGHIPLPLASDSPRSSLKGPWIYQPEANSITRALFESY